MSEETSLSRKIRHSLQVSWIVSPLEHALLYCRRNYVTTAMLPCQQYLDSPWPTHAFACHAINLLRRSERLLHTMAGASQYGNVTN